MNVDIADFLKNKLITAPYTERLAGLTRPVIIKSKSADGTFTSRRIPMGCNVTNPEACPPHKLLVPDSSLSSMAWFEDEGIIFNSPSGRYIDFTSSLRLIVWINLNRYEHDCSLSAAVFMDIIRRIMINYENTLHYQSIKVTSVIQQPKDISVFSSYDFDNKNMYTIYPYDFLSVKITTTFAINRNCFKEINTKNAECSTNTV